MPKNYEEIIKHADELAERFENYEPKAGDEQRVGALARLQLAALRRADVEREPRRSARKNEGLNWEAVGRRWGLPERPPGSPTSAPEKRNACVLSE